MWNNEWKKGVDYPEWGDTDVYKKTISGGYLLYDETPRAVSYTHLRAHETNDLISYAGCGL